MYEALSRWLSPLPGGLIHTNIASCAMFAACSGSSVATSATISRVSLPSFRARGYDERLVLGSLAAGGTLGILIPPSISLIIYGVLVEESIGRLYLAGLFPGLLLAGVFMLMIAATTLVFPRIAPREHMAPLRLRLIGLLSLLPVFGIIFIVLGTIYAGIATPTEAAAFGVTGALVLALLNNSGPVVRGLAVAALKKSGAAALLPGSLGSRIETMDAARLTHTQTLKDTAQANLKMLQDVMLSTVRTSAMIMLIVAAAFTLSFAFARLGIAHNISGWVAALNLNPVILVIILVVFYVVLILVVFYVVLGTFMESLSMMVTTVPILASVLIATGVDLVWFGVIMVILVEAALISPPEGINLYVLHGIRQDVDAEMSAAQGVAVRGGTIGDVWLGVLPFMVCMAIVIGLIIAFPEIALWLPDQLKGVR